MMRKPDETIFFFFFSANRTISTAVVRYILDTVVEELQKDENRTFIYVEMAFFTRWWKEQSDATKEIVSFASLQGLHFWRRFCPK